MRRRDLLKASVGLGALAAAPRSTARTRSGGIDPAPSPVAADRKALFVYGGWPGHEPTLCRDIWVPWLESQKYAVTVSDSQEPYADEALMSSLDLIVQIWTMGTIAKPLLQGLLKAVYEGAGLAGWHGGLADAYRQETDYQFMVGGQWVAHPGGIIDYTVQIVDHEDPVTRGLSDFAVHSEQYYMHVDPNNKVLATTTFGDEHVPSIRGARIPVAWKRVYGKGRVFYSSLGHTASVFDIFEAREIMRRGMLWAGDSRHAETPDLVRPAYPGR